MSLSSVFRKGFRAAARVDGATVGQVPSVSESGELVWVDAGEGGGSQTVLVAEVPLTNAQILAFGTKAGVEIVPTPGLGFFINYIFGQLTIDASAAAYTAAGDDYANGEIGFYWATPGANASVKCTGAVGGVLNDLFGAFGSGAVVVLPPAPGGTFGAGAATSREFSEINGQALLVNGQNALNAAFGGGDAANWGRAKVWYTIEPLTAP